MTSQGRCYLRIGHTVAHRSVLHPASGDQKVYMIPPPDGQAAASDTWPSTLSILLALCLGVCGVAMQSKVLLLLVPVLLAKMFHRR